MPAGAFWELEMWLLQFFKSFVWLPCLQGPLGSWKIHFLDFSNAALRLSCPRGPSWSRVFDGFWWSLVQFLVKCLTVFDGLWYGLWRSFTVFTKKDKNYVTVKGSMGLTCNHIIDICVYRDRVSRPQGPFGSWTLELFIFSSPWPRWNLPRSMHATNFIKNLKRS